MIRQALRWVFLITGATIGAGYASGREIWQFFGPNSGLAILIFAGLFSLAIYTILTISYQMKSTNYTIVLEKLVGKRLAKIYDYLILMYLYFVTAVMVAGSGATFAGFSLPYWLGILWIILALFYILKRDAYQAVVLNERIMPYLITGLAIVLFLFVLQNKISFTAELTGNQQWTSAFPFTALNILPLVAVLGAIGRQIQSKKEIYLAAILSGVILGGLSFLYNMSLVYANDFSPLAEIPLYNIVSDYPVVVTILMMILLWLAIFTTAAANLFGMITRIRGKLPFSEGRVILFILLSMLPFSSFGFSALIAVIYPLYGVLNLYLLSQLILYPIYKRQ